MASEYTDAFRTNLLHAPSDQPQLERQPQPVQPPRFWFVVRFILKSPMQCSSLRRYTTVILGVLSSIAVGGCLGLIGINIGTLLIAFKNLDQGLFDRTFALLAVILAVCIFAKASSEYCMRSVGLMKRSHLNNRLQGMYVCRVPPPSQSSTLLQVHSQ